MLFRFAAALGQCASLAADTLAPAVPAPVPAAAPPAAALPALNAGDTAFAPATLTRTVTPRTKR